MIYGDKIIVISKDIFLLQKKKDQGQLFLAKGSGAPMVGRKCLTRSMNKSDVTEAFDAEEAGWLLA